MAEEWHKVASTSEVDEDEPAAAEIGDKLVAIFKIGDEFFATENVCPHAFVMLSEGFVEDGQVECPLHAAKFDIRTGKCLAPPAEEDLTVYQVKVEGDDIFVKLA
jgi:3-phenylpropionate/trans-cinnamate dioxygenase ferredoxin subunit